MATITTCRGTRAVSMGLLVLLAFSARAVAASGWDCTYEGGGSDPAHYVTHFQKRDGMLVEPHWPAAIAYRILVDTSDRLVAVHASSERTSFRRDAEGSVSVIMIDKHNGRMRRSSGDSGSDTDRVEFGTCERL